MCMCVCVCVGIGRCEVGKYVLCKGEDLKARLKDTSTLDLGPESEV